MGQTYIHAVNIALSIAIVCALAAIYRYDRNGKPALWWMLSFIAVLLMGVGAVVLPYLVSEETTRFVLFVFNILAISCLNVGIAWHTGTAVPWRLMETILATAFVVTFVTGLFLSQHMISATVVALSLAAAQCVGLYILLRMPSEDRDGVFALFLAVGIVNYMSAPLLELLLNEGVGSLHNGAAIIIDVNNSVVMIGLAFFLLFSLSHRLLFDLKGQSETDSLSGLLNRHGFHSAVEKYMDQSESTVTASLIICDLDRFKSINDEYGHYVGDRVIAAFGRLLRAGAREGDLCGRVGGEEFCIYLHNSDIRTARLFAEWLREAFSSISYSELDEDIRFTASFGVAQISHCENIEDAFRRADKALYVAKDDGRNCVRSCNGVGKPAGRAEIRFEVRPERTCKT